MYPPDPTSAAAAVHRDELLRVAARERRARACHPVAIRRATADDRGELRRFLTRLSPLSLFQRFHGGGFRITEQVLDLLLRRDGTGAAVVAVDEDGIVGHAMWAPAREGPTVGDIGVVVTEAFRGRRIASRLVDAVVADAAAQGIETLEAAVLADNDATHRLVRRISPDAVGISEDGVVDYRLDVDAAVAAEPAEGLRAALRRAVRRAA